MSAYFVSRQTIHDAVSAWSDHFPQPRSQHMLDLIGLIFWKMNSEALRQRYPSIIGTDEDRENEGNAASYCYRHPVNLSKAQAAKSVHCLTYQCSEGSVPETATYKALDRLGEALGKPPFYASAVWDRENDTPHMLRTA